MISDTCSYDYDVALSFAGEDRSVAEPIASLLMENNIRVFYDLHEEATLWGKDLYQYLCHVYRDRARFCLVFLSASYAKKAWTKHELKQAQARAISENAEYILPLRIDDTEIPGITSTMAYIDLRTRSISEVVSLVLAKLRHPETMSSSDSKYLSQGLPVEASASQLLEKAAKTNSKVSRKIPSDSEFIKIKGNVSGIINFGTMGNAEIINIRNPESSAKNPASYVEMNPEDISDGCLDASIQHDE